MNSGVEGLIHKILSRSSPKPSPAAPNWSTTREQPKKKNPQNKCTPSLSRSTCTTKDFEFQKPCLLGVKFHEKLKYRKRGGKRFADVVWSRKEDKETKEKKIFLAALCSMWDLSPLTRDQTRTPCIGSLES